jgi:hypothetical protein
MIIMWENLKKYVADKYFEFLADFIFLVCDCMYAGQWFSHCKARDFVYLDSLYLLRWHNFVL